MLVTANIFQPLISVFEHVITFFHGVGISWGWSIVLLTICVRIVLLPLTVKMFTSMRKMQHLQPQMKAIQQKYKQDKQRQQQEMMKFYKDNEVNPAASCLPLVAQLPVMISLFYMLRKNLRTDICPGVQQRFQAHYAALHHIAAKSSEALGQTVQCTNYHAHYAGAGFLFINDITNTASGLTLVILLVLYVGTQLASTMLMSSPTMDPSQRRLMMFMPLIFVVFILRFPAGLIVYWITTNAWTMAQQYTLKRLAGPPPAAIVDTTTTTTGGGSGRDRGSSFGNGGGSSGNGPADGSSGGFAGLLRGLSSRASSNGESTGRSGGAGRSGAGRGNSNAASTPATPPRPPRKKKKRSGRRR
jgi:YidC/Oxa1 family membrane protein insertase